MPETARAPVSLADATRKLHAAALARAVDARDDAERVAWLLGRFALRARVVDLAADAAVREAAHDLLSHGWTPREVHAFGARRLDPLALTYLVDALAATAQVSAGVPWLSELSAVPARIWWTVGRPHLEQWTARHGVRRGPALRVVVDVLALLRHVPRTDACHPGPTSRRPLPAGALVHDTRIARRIDALLARAGDGGYPAEATASAAKAQDLLVRHATLPPTSRLRRRT